MKYQAKFIKITKCCLFFTVTIFSFLFSLPSLATQVHPENGHVALTFDDGPSKYTLEVLQILKKYNIKATFFIIGENAERYPGLVREIEREGHVVANHTMTHPMLTRVSDDRLRYELAENSRILKQITGYAPACLRPPYGDQDQHVDDVAHSLGMQVVTWNVNSRDYTRPGVERLELNVLSKTNPNFIILMHDGGGDRSQTVAALPVIIEGLRKRGMQFDTICDPGPMQAKQQPSQQDQQANQIIPRRISNSF